MTRRYIPPDDREAWKLEGNESSLGQALRAARDAHPGPPTAKDVPALRPLPGPRLKPTPGQLALEE